MTPSSRPPMHELTLNGLCLGAHQLLLPGPESRLAGAQLYRVVAPITSRGRPLSHLAQTPHFPSELIVQRYGGLPANLMNTGFKMLRPTLEAQALSGLWANVNRPGYVDGYKAMSRWANDFIGMPGRFFHQLSDDMYAQNRLVNLYQRPPRRPQPHRPAPAGRRRQPGLHRPGPLRPQPDGHRVQRGQGIRGAPRRPHLRLLRSPGPPDPLAQNRRVDLHPFHLTSMRNAKTVPTPRLMPRSSQ